MLRFIWNSWWRNKERFLLLIIGALIVSIGLSYLVGITQANNGTIVDELQKRWKASYHIVVRPPDSRSITEDKKLLEPNYLSGLNGGISLEQYENIKNITEIDVAAPIAMMGYIKNTAEFEKVQYSEPGIYRMTRMEKVNNGIEIVVDEASTYFTVGAWEPAGLGKEYGATVMRIAYGLNYGSETILAGIDPEAEAALVGLDEAIIKTDTSRFFAEEDKVETFQVIEDIKETRIPVLISNKEFVDGKVTYIFEKLDLPFADDPASIMEEVKEKGGKSYLEKISGEFIEEYRYTTEQAHEQIVKQISNLIDGEISATSNFYWMAFKPSPVNYREVTSPFAERWPFSYEVQPYKVPEDSILPIDHAYRPVAMFGETGAEWPRLQFKFVGVFDPHELKISKDPLTELPMETYFPAKAKWVINKDENPVNPPQVMKPLNNPYGFLTKPPLILTTIEAAAEVLGDKPISAIRVKVKGVEELTEESEKILQEVATNIENKTGLITDIVLGSSPQPAITHIPGIGETENIGWIEQPWIKLGSSVSIFKESKIGMSGVISSVIFVAIVYVFSSNIIMMYARKKEFAVLLSMGWRPNQLTKLLFVEAAFIGLFVSGISWVILGLIYVTNDIETSGLRLFLIGIFGIAIYLLGALIPGLAVRKISPYETMKAGEISHQKRYFQTKSIISMSCNNLLAKWKRSILSIIAIALPTSLLVFFLFITFRLRGIMYTTWLGEYVAMEVGPMHYVAMGVAIAIAILTTTEIIWQNVAERHPELAVLKALGWQNITVSKLVILEGALSGLIAGVLGIFTAFFIIWGMYGAIPADQLYFFLAVILIPIITGIIGAILPARKAVKIQPYQGLSGSYGQTKRTEKGFKYVFGVIGACLFVGLSVLLSQVIPDIEKEGGSSQVTQSNFEGTTGEITEQVVENNEQGEIVEEEKEMESELVIDAYKTIKLDEYAFNSSNKKLFFGKPIATPSNVETVNISEEMKIVTIPITYETKLEGFNQINPFIFDIVSATGEKIDPYNMTVLENDGWKGGRIIGSGKVTFANTYVIPKNELGWRIVFKDWGFRGDRTYMVEIADDLLEAVPLNESDMTSGFTAIANYNIEILLDSEHTFHIQTDIEVKNQSNESWKDVGFYFIPNAFTKEYKPGFMKDTSEITISNVMVNDNSQPYTLTNNKLTVQLDENLDVGNTLKVIVDYTLNLPEYGNRLSREEENYYLAQWYPMLGNYQNGWQIENYDPSGESYYTGYGDYEIHYEFPKEYYVVSSGIDGEIQPSKSGSIYGTNIKDFYIGLLEPESWKSKSVKVNDTVLRVFLPIDYLSFEQTVQDAVGAFSFFEERIGENPNEEIDIIGNNGGMEYPNVVEVSRDEVGAEHTIVHELAHQWFYYLVSNDPYHEAWLDEGITEFATNLYLTEKYDDEKIGFEFPNRIGNINVSDQYVNKALGEFDSSYFATIYSRVPLQLWKFFEEHGGVDEALQFLSAYYEEYQLKLVHTEDFIEFFNGYFQEEYTEFFNGWLELE